MSALAECGGGRLNRARRLLALAGTMLIAATSLVVAAEPAVVAASPPSIVGTVTSSATSAPLAGIIVTAYLEPYNCVGSACTPDPIVDTTDSSGQYSFDFVGGCYTLVVTDPSGSYGLDQDYNCLQAGYQDANDFVLDPGGRIGGTITRETGGAPLAGACVHFSPQNHPSWNREVISCANASGDYQSPGLPADSYRLWIEGPSGSPVAPEYYDNTTSWSSAALVAVSAGSSVTSIDAALGDVDTSGPRINLTLRGDDTGSAISGCALISGPAGQYVWYGCSPTGSIVSPTLSAGSYRLSLSDPQGNYLAEYYDGASSLGAATLVEVTDAPVAVIASLTPASRITGVVEDDQGNRASGVDVAACVSPGFTECVSGATAPDGSYELFGLRAGVYSVQFGGPPLWDFGYWGGATTAPGTLVTVGVGQTIPLINGVVQRLGGSLTGSVLDSSSGAPIAGATVRVYQLGQGYATADTTTDASGHYSFANLLPGSYQIDALAVGYASETYDNVPFGGDPASRTTVVVGAGATVTGINFALDPEAAIVGTVTGNPAVPGSSFCVTARPIVGTWERTDCGRIGSTFRISKLPAGQYTVVYSSADYRTEYWDDSPTAAGAQFITVGVGQTFTANATLVQKGKITGTVRDAASGSPLAGVAVLAYDSAGSWVGSVLTNTAGVYEFALDDGSYRLQVQPYSVAGYSPVWYPSASTMQAATAVAVAAGTVQSGIDFGLTRLPYISGVITDAATSQGLVNAYVSAYAADGSWGGVAFADASGRYTLYLPAASYRLSFSASNHVTEWFENASSISGATPAMPTPSGTTIDVSLDPYVALSGSVTNSRTLQPVAGALVTVYTAAGTWAGATNADAAGHFSFLLPSGTYKLFSSATDYVWEWFDNASLMSSATPIVLASGGATVDVSLEPVSRISGVVTNAKTGGPVNGAQVLVTETSTHAEFSFLTSVDGSYTATLPAGTYRVSFPGAVQTMYSYRNLFRPQWYNGAPTESAAQDITLSGGTVVGVSAALDPYLRVTGTVTESGSGLPIGDQPVRAYTAAGVYVTETATDGDGQYTIALDSGIYLLRFPTRTHIDEYYHDADSAATATLVRIDADDVVADESLDLGASITGHLVDRGGLPAQACVFAVSVVTGGSVNSMCTGSDGSFELAGLRGGSYRLQYVRSGRWGWFGGSDFMSATNIDVSDLGTTDVTVPVEPSVVGRLVAEGSAAPVSGSVRVFDASTGNTVTTVFGASDGTFSVAGLPAGSYLLEFAAGGYVNEYWDNAADQATATPVVVGADAADLGDVALAPAGALLTGTVALADGTPVGDMCISLSAIGGTFFVPQVCSGPDGRYSIALPPDQYVGYVFPQFGGSPYLPQQIGALNPIALVTGPNVRDFTVDIGGRVGGVVTDDITGLPVAGIQVRLEAVPGFEQTSITTAADGSFSTSAVPPGTYRVHYTNPAGRYIGEYFDDSLTASGSATITLASGDIATANASMLVGSLIRGRVLDARTLLPLANACVEFYSAGGERIDLRCTDELGRYASPGLAAGSYVVSAAAALHEDRNVVVGVVAGADTLGTDILLQPYGYGFEALVRSAVDQQPLTGACATLYTDQAGTPVGDAVCTDESGLLVVHAPDAGQYWVRVEGPAGGQYVGQWISFVAQDATVNPFETIDLASTPTSPPVAPTDVLAQVAVGQIGLTWVDASADESGFEIWRLKVDPSSGAVTIGRTYTVAAGTTSDTDVPSTDGTYVYVVRSVNAAGASAWGVSNVVTFGAPAPTVPPSTPLSLTATAGASGVELQWVLGVDPGDHVEIWRLAIDPSTGAATQDASFTATGTTTTDHPDLPGYYVYVVRAVNAAGASGWAVSDVTIFATTPPAAPTSAAGTSTDAGVDLSWADLSSNEAGFEIWRLVVDSATGASSVDAVLTAPRNATSLHDVPAVGDYVYVVRSVNAFGASGWSVTGVISYGKSAPPAPGLAEASVTGASVHLSWTDNSLTETGFEVWRIAVDPATGASSVGLTTTVAQNATSFDESGLAAGTYVYVVRSSNPYGASSWAVSNVFAVA